MYPQKSDGVEESERAPASRGLSWGAMLVIVGVAILVAAAFAYLLVNPFFHQHAP